MPERSRGRHGRSAVALRVAIVLALVPLVATACGDDDGEDAATPTPTVAETVDATVTDAATEDGATTGGTTTAPPPPPPGPVIRFRGNGDRTLPPVQVGQGGATLAWRNGDAVFTLLSNVGTVIDTVEPRGETTTPLPAGRYLFDVVASGDWSFEIRNARRAR